MESTHALLEGIQITAEAKKRSEQCSDEEYYAEQERLSNKVKGCLNIVDGYDCPLCNNRGYLLKERELDGRHYETYVECKCMKYRREYRRMKARRCYKEVYNGFIHNGYGLASSIEAQGIRVYK